jgi:hypothetical protein
MEGYVLLIKKSYKFMAEREGFSSAPYRKSRERNEFENNSFIFFILSDVSIVFPVSLVLSSALKK